MRPTHGARERLVSAAADLFHTDSYGAVGVQKICEEADVRRGSFFYYFPSKLDLALAVLDYEHQQLVVRVFEPAFDNDLPPLMRFTKLLETLAEYHSDRATSEGGTVGGCPIANLGQELSGRHASVREKVVAIFESLDQLYAEPVKLAIEAGDLPADVDPERTATRLRSYVQGLLEAAKFEADPSLLTRFGIDVSGLAIAAAA